METSKSQSGPVISVFGSSRPVAGSESYELASNVGRLLALAGFGVATGGYSGTMEAVSRGAASAGGRVVGVGASRIETFRPGGLNQWVTESVRYETLRDRVLHLVTENQGMIVLPGGVGTLSEMALAWSFLQVGEIQPRPLILMGDMWRETMRAFIRDTYVPDGHARLLSYADSPEAAVEIVKREVRHGGQDVA